MGELIAFGLIGAYLWCAWQGSADMHRDWQRYLRSQRSPRRPTRG